MDMGFLRMVLENQGVVLDFSAAAELESWFKREENAWSWLTLVRDPEAVEVATAQAETIVRVGEAIERYKSGPGDKVRLGDVRDAIVQTFGAKKGFLSDGREGRFILDLAVKSPIAGAGAASYFAGLPFHRSRHHMVPQQFVRGYTLAMLFESGISGADAEKESLDGLRKAYAKRLDGMAELEADLRDRIADTSARASHNLDEQSARLSQHVDSQTQYIREKVEAAKGELAALKNTYEDLLRLQAPSKYWTLQYRAHRKNALGFGAAACVALVVGILFLRSLLLSAEADRVFSPVEMATTVLFAAAVVWVVRILVRLLLSNIHLATDANQRAVMVTTYLALRYKGRVDESDRVFVLESLFRPTQTGIVRDDGAPPGIAEVISRIDRKG